MKNGKEIPEELRKSFDAIAEWMSQCLTNEVTITLDCLGRGEFENGEQMDAVRYSVRIG